MGIEQIALKVSEDNFKEKYQLNDKINTDMLFLFHKNTVSLMTQYEGPESWEDDRFRYKELNAIINCAANDMFFEVYLDGVLLVSTPDFLEAVVRYNEAR